jgi:uncharacterized protein (DUF362 family)
VSDHPTRREFLLRIGAASAAAAGVAGVAAWLAGRPGSGAAGPGTRLPDFATAGAGPPLVIARGEDPARLVSAGLEEMGGIGRFVSKGDVVLVKPNAAFDRPPWQGATTHPGVLAAVVAACVRAGAAEVLVTDNPIHAPESAFRKSGLAKAAEDAGGKVLLPAENLFAPIAAPGSLLDGWPALAIPLRRATKLIGIAPVKDHNLARASLGMKNLYGLLGGPRNRLHQRLDEAIAALGAVFRPTLSILDGVRILTRNGPTGGSPEDVVPGNVLAFGTDPVAADAFGATLLRLDPAALPWLELAEARGLGTADFRSLSPKEIDA